MDNKQSFSSNNLFSKIQEDLKFALKNQNQDDLRTLRFLLAEVNNQIAEKYSPQKGGIPVDGIPNEDIIQVIQKQVKTHKESIEAFKAGHRQDLVTNEEKELSILQKYLPPQISEEEIKKIIEEIKSSGINDFGQIMKEVMAKVKGKADGSLVAKIVKESL
ncbi:MAG: GatB/YqeY domain-containing protein [Candidatus Gottesmanbacteria bacterium]